MTSRQSTRHQFGVPSPLYPTSSSTPSAGVTHSTRTDTYMPVTSPAAQAPPLVHKSISMTPWTILYPRPSTTPPEDTVPCPPLPWAPSPRRPYIRTPSLPPILAPLALPPSSPTPCHSPISNLIQSRRNFSPERRPSPAAPPLRRRQSSRAPFATPSVPVDLRHHPRPFAPVAGLPRHP
jgi:hypothetical protein